MRVALFGAGSIGMRHLASLEALGHDAVVVDTDPKRGTYRKLSAQCGTLDAAIIATPAQTHLSLLRDCITWGLPVLVEKPVGMVADLPTLRALRPTKPVMVAYQLRFHPDVRRIQPLLSTAAAGILQCKCDSRTWPGSAATGDFIAEFSHEIDLALHFGAPHMVSHIAASEHDACVRLGNFVVRLADRADGYVRRWELFDQPRGSYDVQFHSSEEYDADATVRCHTYTQVELDAVHRMYRDELAHFLRAVQGGPITPGCTLEEGIAVLDVVAQIKAQA